MARVNSPIDIDLDMSGIILANATLVPRMMSALHALFEYEARGLESYMRSNAPWQDQTGNARNGLFARPFSEVRGSGTRNSSGQFQSAGAHVGIDLFHTVPYGIWLETRFSGRYAIIVPTINSRGPDVIASARNLLGRMR